MRYKCPVCFYGGLPHPPVDYMICPCCGTEFGYTDFNTSHEELRKKWLRAGAHWHSKTFPPPSGWNFYDQLKRAGHLADLYEITGPNKQVAGE